MFCVNLHFPLQKFSVLLKLKIFVKPKMLQLLFVINHLGLLLFKQSFYLIHDFFYQTLNTMIIYFMFVYLSEILILWFTLLSLHYLKIIMSTFYCTHYPYFPTQLTASSIMSILLNSILTFKCDVMDYFIWFALLPRNIW